MAAELSRFMADYSHCRIKHRVAPDYSTRRQRRSAMKTILQELAHIKVCEERSLDNTPENLLSAPATEVTEEAIASLDEALEALTAFWMVP